LGVVDFYKKIIFLYINPISPLAGPLVTQGHNMNNLGSRPLDDDTYQISKLEALWFLRNDFFYEPPNEALFDPRGIILTIFVKDH